MGAAAPTLDPDLVTVTVCVMARVAHCAKADATEAPNHESDSEAGTDTADEERKETHYQRHRDQSQQGLR